jgi:Gas vesicle synthesis protein GvpL/GvpF
MSSSTTSICYVYGIVPSALDAASAPEGLDGARVALEHCDGVAALVSSVDGESYAPSVLEQSTGDVEWMSPRAVAHDRVLTWASDRGAVIPMPMFSLFTGSASVQRMLCERSPQLAETLRRVSQGREYALRVYRVDAELMEAMTSLSPRLAELAAKSAAASPGQRYLLERKLDDEKRSEMRGVTTEVTDAIVGALSADALESARSPIPRVTDAAGRGTMVLNAAFLVAPDRLMAFQQTLTSLVEQHGARGFRFDFTGPWPPYHFASGNAAGNGA